MRKPIEMMTVPCSGCGLPHEVPKGPYLASRKWGKRPNYHGKCLREKNKKSPIAISHAGENKGLAYGRGGEYTK